MNALNSVSHRHLTKVVFFGAVFAATLLAFSFGADSAQAEGPLVLNRGNIAALNPQPLPPRYLGLASWYSKYRSFGGAVSLNPQPLPPRWIGARNLPRPGAAVSLNPQPLPPKAIFIPLLKTR